MTNDPNLTDREIELVRLCAKIAEASDAPYAYRAARAIYKHFGLQKEYKDSL